MGFLDRFIKKPKGPSVTQRAVPELCGGMTAHQAWAVVAPIVQSMDRQARLTLITSGLDMKDKGCSLTWEFIFFLPIATSALCSALRLIRSLRMSMALLAP
jgi:hypothetical protein